MDDVLARPRAAIQGLLDAALGFQERIRDATPSHELPKARLQTLDDICGEIPTRVAALSQSVTLIEQTSLDIVDMETRMQNETRKLAELLEALGKSVHEQFFMQRHFEDQLVGLDEAAQALAAGLFPSAVQGLNMVNSKLWEFTNLQMIIYRNTFESIKDTFSPKTRTTVESEFQRLRQPFDALNQFLNDLALRALRGADIEKGFSQINQDLAQAKVNAATNAEVKAFSPFRSVLKAAGDIANALQDRLKAIRAPVFPAQAELEELEPSVDDTLYDSLTGLQAFALLNIGSRMRGIKLGRASMLSPRFALRVFDAFPDRIYCTANASLLDAVGSSSEFAKAPASLHKFRAGSFKQRTFAEGNLQVSHSDVVDGRIKVDVDIDLYRDPLRHMFGEVLQNHLTGQKTDAFKVRRILDEQGVTPIGGFHIASPA